MSFEFTRILKTTQYFINIKQSVQNLSEIISETADLIYMWFYFFIFHRYIYTYLYVNTCQKLNAVELSYSLSMIYSISII